MYPLTFKVDNVAAAADCFVAVIEYNLVVSSSAVTVIFITLSPSFNPSLPLISTLAFSLLASALMSNLSISLSKVTA